MVTFPVAKESALATAAKSTELPGEFADIAQLLQYRARTTPDRLCFTYLNDGESESGRQTYAHLDAGARAVAACLQTRCERGDRVLVLIDTAADFISAFFGCLYSGVLSVPALAPRADHALERIARIAADAGAGMVLATSRVIALLREQPALAPALSGLQCLDIADALAHTGMPDLQPHEPDAIAFLQYTSGSTGAPKGVMVSHRNLLATEKAIQAGFLHDPDSIVVGWLPLFHDMGLIGNVLQPIYVGCPAILMPPNRAVQKPMRVLRAISRYRATTCGAPNFFYDLCVSKFSRAELEADGIPDLSSWTRAYNGSEPVRAETLERFAAVFGVYGFERKGFYPCYGLAEATLFVSGLRKVAAPRVLRLDKPALERDAIEPVAAESDGIDVVSCGPVALGHEVAIVCPRTGKLRPAGETGEIWVHGPAVASGYWGQDPQRSQVFGARLQPDDGARYLRTGDLGFMDGDELFITGRIKDVIIVNGRNHYPHDIELTAQRSHSALRPGGGAAFTIDRNGEQRLCLVHEVERQALHDLNELEVRSKAREAIAKVHDLRLSELALLLPGAIPRTSSGKIRRSACRQAYLTGELRTVARAPAGALHG